MGTTTLVALAPCSPVYHRVICHKSGRRNLSTVPAKFWGNHCQMTDTTIEVRLKHLPVFRFYPTWIVCEYRGGNPLKYLRRWSSRQNGETLEWIKNSFGYQLTLWWVRHQPEALDYRPLLEVLEGGDSSERFLPGHPQCSGCLEIPNSNDFSKSFEEA